MTLKAFLFLMVVAIVAVACSAFIAERLLDPGFERGILIAVLSGLVVFPAARWAEYRGWIKGAWSPGGTLRKAADQARADQARADQAAREAAAPADAARETAARGEAASVLPSPSDAAPPAGRPSSPGESR